MLSQKEEDNFELATRLRLDGIITTPGAPFEESDASEIDNLVARDVFNFERFNPITHRAIRLFKSRMVREVKNKSTKQGGGLFLPSVSEQRKQTWLSCAQTPNCLLEDPALILQCPAKDWAFAVRPRQRRSR